MTRFAVAAAVNDQAVLRQCLSASPDIASGRVSLRTYEGYGSASLAYNRALAEAECEILILAHQDVYLPAGYINRLDRALSELDRIAPDWAVAGVVGADPQGVVHGRVWASGLGTVVGGDGTVPAEVEALDEMIIFIRRDAGLRFDERLPGFHLYAADIIQIAASTGRTSWVVDAPAVHHSRPVRTLDGSYKKAWYYMRRKWRERLPIANLVCNVTAWPWPLWERDWRLRLKYRGQRSRSQPQGDPAEIAKRVGFET